MAEIARMHTAKEPLTDQPQIEGGGPVGDGLDDWSDKGENNAVVDQASQPFVGRWNTLVSTTNWEKGHIIQQWREALERTAAPAVEYSDEAWSRRVGGVTGQHVGRLRRVYQRFGQVHEKFQGLYWSHFQATLDWDDAEMWLEGAVQSRWSVSRMRRQRWEVMGGLPEQEPRDEDVVMQELDEDFEPALNQQPITGEIEDVPGRPVPAGPDFGEESDRESDDGALQGHYAGNGDAAADSDRSSENEPVELIRPFVNLAQLPDDLIEAFEAYKLAILHHKADSWRQISCQDVLASLDALKELALAPSVAAT